MKGIQGLIVAAGLGVVGFFLNYMYLHSESRKHDRLWFFVVKTDAPIRAGEALSPDNLEPLPIPRAQAEGMKDYAEVIDPQNGPTDPAAYVRDVLAKIKVWHDLPHGWLLLKNDLRTPPPERLELGKDEEAFSVPVDGKTEMSLVDPGDVVAFIVPLVARPTLAPRPARPPAETPPPATPPGAGQDGTGLQPIPDPASAPAPAAETKEIGPFVVLAVGGRLCSMAVARANRLPLGSQNIVTIRVDHDSKQAAQALEDAIYAQRLNNVGLKLLRTTLKQR